MAKHRRVPLTYEPGTNSDLEWTLKRLQPGRAVSAQLVELATLGTLAKAQGLTVMLNANGERILGMTVPVGPITNSAARTSAGAIPAPVELQSVYHSEEGGPRGGARHTEGGRGATPGEVAPAKCFPDAATSPRVVGSADQGGPITLHRSPAGPSISGGDSPQAIVNELTPEASAVYVQTEANRNAGSVKDGQVDDMIKMLFDEFNLGQ